MVADDCFTAEIVKKATVKIFTRTSLSPPLHQSDILTHLKVNMTYSRVQDAFFIEIPI